MRIRLRFKEGTIPRDRYRRFPRKVWSRPTTDNNIIVTTLQIRRWSVNEQLPELLRG